MEKNSKIYNAAHALIAIQAELDVKKGIFNEFGNFWYRKAEDILAIAKPIAKKYNSGIVLSDVVQTVLNRYYLISTATLVFVDSETGYVDSISATGYAREIETKTKMDEAQITGAASSYARKYALCGLLAIDSGEDPDQLNNSQDKKPSAAKGTFSTQGGELPANKMQEIMAALALGAPWKEIAKGYSITPTQAAQIRGFLTPTKKPKQGLT